MVIYIGNLPSEVESEDLKEFFTEYGFVKTATVIRDRQTGYSRGFGYVKMPDEAAALKAIQELDGGKVLGQEIRVTKARPRKPKK